MTFPLYYVHVVNHFDFSNVKSHMLFLNKSSLEVRLFNILLHWV